MSLTRYLPTPSDCMGILWTLLQIEDAVILEYGTLGTAAYAMKTFGMMGMQVGGKLFATGLDEQDVVMGETGKLEIKLKELDETYHPKVIFVLASSVSSVTGSDVKGICTYMQKEVNAKIITFTEGGFGGDYSKGLESAYTTLVSSLVTTPYDMENGYNIIGLSAMNPNANGDLAEIQRMMSRYFNLQPIAVLSLETQIQNIEAMAKAKINIVLSYEGLRGAKILEERFGTPYVYGLPIGYKGTLDWLLEIAKCTEVHLSRKIIGELSSKIEKNGKAKKVAIYGEYDMVLYLSNFMRGIGAEVEMMLCSHNINRISNKPSDIVHEKEEKEKIKWFANLENTLIFGDDCFIFHANETNKKIHIANGETVLGISGAKRLAKA